MSADEESLLAAANRATNEAIVALIDSWLDEPADYDQVVWSEVKKGLEENRAGARRLFRSD